MNKEYAELPRIERIERTERVSEDPEQTNHEGPIYRIIRFYRSDRSPRTIKQRLYLSEARAHCKREDTHGPDWFDGYDLMRGFKHRQ